jgi:hypothetical protein
MNGLVSNFVLNSERSEISLTLSFTGEGDEKLMSQLQETFQNTEQR